ncbi:MAG: hypothetical protein ACKVOE_06850 [Rickettsiales bacterium]
MQKNFLRTTALILIASPALAAATLVASPAYKECTALATSNPTAALAKADEWLKIDQGIAAQHCRAMALFGLRRFDEAATGLSQVRDLLGPENLSLRMYVTRQTARAWIQANRADAALADYSAQLDYLAKIRGNNAIAAELSAGLLLDRARLNITYGKLAEAASDLDHAVSLTPLNPDLLLERAGVFEQLGDRALARLDAKSVLKLRAHDSKAQALLARVSDKPAAGLAPIPEAQTAPEAAPAASIAAPVTPVSSVPAAVLIAPPPATKAPAPAAAK